MKWYDNWRGHKPAIITLVVLIGSLKTLPRFVERAGLDVRVVGIWIGIDIGLVAWALWDELRKKYSRDR